MGSYKDTNSNKGNNKLMVFLVYQTGMSQYICTIPKLEWNSAPLNWQFLMTVLFWKTQVFKNSKKKKKNDFFKSPQATYHSVINTKGTIETVFPHAYKNYVFNFYLEKLLR